MLPVHEVHRAVPCAGEAVGEGETESELHEGTGPDRRAAKVLAREPDTQKQAAADEDYAVPDTYEADGGAPETQAGAS